MVRVVFLMVMISIAADSSVVAQEAMDLSNDADWGKFYSSIQQSDLEGLDRLLSNLGDSKLVKSPIERRAGMMASIAERYVAGGAHDKAQRAFQAVMELTPPESPEAAVQFATAWRSATNAWAQRMYDDEQLESLIMQLREISPNRGGFAQKVVHAEVVGEWIRRCAGEANAYNLERLSYLRECIPAKPHHRALHEFTSFAENARGVDVPQKLQTLQHIRSTTRKAIEDSPEENDAALYLLRLRQVNRAIAYIYLDDPARVPLVAQLSDEVGNYAKLVEDLLPKSHPRYEKALSNIGRQRSEFDREVKLKVRRREDLSDPRIFQSKLVGQPRPEIIGETLLGRLPEDRGRVLLLDFWSTTCGPCINAFPKLIDLSQRFESEGLSIVGITNLPRSRWDSSLGYLKRDLDASKEVRQKSLRRFIQNHGVNFTQVVDDHGATADSYEVVGYPRYVVIGRDGLVKLVCGGGSSTFELLRRTLVEELAVEHGETPASP